MLLDCGVDVRAAFLLSDILTAEVRLVSRARTLLVDKFTDRRNHTVHVLALNPLTRDNQAVGGRADVTQMANTCGPFVDLHLSLCGFASRALLD